jgi:hypothetical protein
MLDDHLDVPVLPELEIPSLPELEATIDPAIDEYETELRAAVDRRDRRAPGDASVRAIEAIDEDLQDEAEAIRSFLEAVRQYQRRRDFRTVLLDAEESLDPTLRDGARAVVAQADAAERQAEEDLEGLREEAQPHLDRIRFLWRLKESIQPSPAEGAGD